MTSEEQAFVNGASRLGVRLDEGHLERFRAYYRELIEWNRSRNLTAITAYGDVLTRHFLDALTLVPVMRRLRPDSEGTHADIHLIDVGTGAGFPGVPLLVVFPGLRVTLLDSVRKRTEFCEHLVRVLKLPGASIVTARGEEAGRDPTHRERYDLAVSRAVDRLPALAEYLLPFCRLGGLAIAMKKGDIAAEVAEAQGPLAFLGGSEAEIIPVDPVSGLDDDRQLVVMQKIAPTSARYPRRSGLPHRHPLSSLIRGLPPRHPGRMQYAPTQSTDSAP